MINGVITSYRSPVEIVKSTIHFAVLTILILSLIALIAFSFQLKSDGRSSLYIYASPNQKEK